MRTRKAAPPADGSLERFVELVAPHLPAGLIGAAGESGVSDPVREVPAELVSRFAFECALGTDPQAANVLFCADAETGGLQMLAGRHPLVKLPPAIARSDSWEPVVRFCRHREPGLLLHRATKDVWADLAEAVPSFAFGLRLAGLPEAPRRPLEVLVRALELGFESLRGAPLGAPTLTTLRSLLRRMPETARVSYGAVMRARPEAVRLWLDKVAREEIVDVVEVTREHSEALGIARVLDEIIHPTATVRPRIDLEHAVAPAVGLVCTIDGSGTPGDVARRWEPLLEQLVEAGLCADDKREALLLAFGLLRERTTGGWPEHLTRLSELFGEGAESIVSWRPSHVTIECVAGEPVDATACVVASHGWSRQ